jgi:hypothetical protein
MNAIKIGAVAVAIALLMSLAASSAHAARPTTTTTTTTTTTIAEGRRLVPIEQLVSFAGLDIEIERDQVIGMTVLRKDGTWLPLAPAPNPSGATQCTGGQTLTCWESEAELMTICVCTGGGQAPTLRIVSEDGTGLPGN